MLDNSNLSLLPDSSSGPQFRSRTITCLPVQFSRSTLLVSRPVAVEVLRVQGGTMGHLHWYSDITGF